MEYRKERNIIKAYEDGALIGGWNISTGEFIGKSGKPVKSTPACFTFNRLRNNNAYTRAILLYRTTWQSGHHWCGDYTPARANRLEQMVSLQIIPSSYCDLDSTVPLTKEVVNFIRTYCNGFYNTRDINHFVATSGYRKHFGDAPKWVFEVVERMEAANIPQSFFVPALKRAIREHWEKIFPNARYYDFAGFFAPLLKDYYNLNMTMYGKVNVEPNMLTRVCEIRDLYDKYISEHYNDILKQNNDKPFLYFETDTLIAKPILTKEGFHDEADQQHNCVERLYMEEVKEGNTYIVSIRRKSNPEKAYITCEVELNGHIRQYLAFANQYVQDEDGRNFQNLYQNHLSLSLSK